MPNKDKFLNEVLSYVKFPFDREEIKRELENHILDKTEFYNDQGYNAEQAEELAIKDMGDTREIGVELNKQHNPFIGWVWIITNKLVFISVLLSVYFLAVPLINHFLYSNLANTIPQSNIVYQIDLDEQVKIDDRVIKFTHVIYEKNGNMNIIYEYYDTSRVSTLKLRIESTQLDSRIISRKLPINAFLIAVSGRFPLRQFLRELVN